MQLYLFMPITGTNCSLVAMGSVLLHAGRRIILHLLHPPEEKIMVSGSVAELVPWFIYLWFV